MAFWGQRGHGGSHRRRRRSALLAASERLYGALLALYPRSFRHRYASEMRRDFRDLLLEGLEEGGGRELVRVWAATLSDLVVTSLQERSTVLARNAYLPVAPRIVAGLMVAIVLIAVTVTLASLVRTPQYEASIKILVRLQEGGDSLGNSLYEVEKSTLTISEAISSRPVAKAVIRQLDLRMSQEEFIENLRVDQEPNTLFINVSYADPDPRRAHLVANTVGEVVSKRVSEVSLSANSITATVWQPAVLPDDPVSPKPVRNGLLVLVLGLMPLGLMVIVGLAMSERSDVATGVGDNANQMARPVGKKTASRTRGTPTRVSVTEAAKEKELLEALVRRGRLTVAGVALETSLSVKEADRMLSALAAKGHLEVRVEHGRLLYSLWEHRASP